MSLKRIALPWAVVVLGPLLLFGPMLVRGQVLFWGAPMLQFIPWHTWALNTLGQGYLPLWNPWLGMGAPLVANYQSALLYPPNAILALTGPAWGHGLLVMLHLIFAGVGMVLLVRRLGMGVLAQSIGGLTYALSGYVVARAGFLSLEATAAWFPWVLVAADRMATGLSSETSLSRGWKWVAPLAVVLGLQWLAGHAQVAWYSLLFASAWTLGRGVSLGRKAVGRALIGLSAACLLAFALSAAQLLPTLEYLLQSYRASRLDPTFAMTYSFWPWRLLGLLTPGLFGNPASGNYWGYGNYWEDAIYVGVLPVVLAFVAGVRAVLGRGDRARLGRWLLAAIAVAFVLALGSNTPVFPFLFRSVPTFSLFQAPTRWNLIPELCLCLLAAIGAEQWQALSGRGLYWTRLGTAGAAAIAVVAWLGGQRMAAVQPTFTHAIAAAGVWLTVVGALALARRATPGRMWTAGAVTGLVADLVLAAWGLNPSVSPSVFAGRSNLSLTLPGGHRLFMPADVADRTEYKRFFRFDTFEAVSDWTAVREAGLPNLPLLDPMSSANNYDPLLPDRYVKWVQALAGLPAESQSRLLSLMDVGWLAVADTQSPAGLHYESLPAPARVRVVPHAVWVDSPDAAFERALDPTFDPEAQVILEGAARDVAGGGGEARIIDSPNPSRVVIDVAAPEGGWLVLSDVWYPGWSSTVDGAPTTILRADYLFRAVWVPPGRHSVEFSYRSFWLFVGASISTAAWLILLLAGWRWRHA